MNNPANALAQPVSLIAPGGAPIAQAVTPKFAVGDLVNLKSGGPTMCIAKNVGDGRVEACYYCERNATFVGAMFFQDMLDIPAPKAA